MNPQNYLQTQWFDLMEALEIDPTQSQVYFDQLCVHYNEKHRAYHNLHHIQELFQLLSPFDEEMEQSLLVYLAVFYHDIIYNAKRKDNELKSAELAVEVMQKIGLKKQDQQYVYDLILATKNHQAPFDDEGLFYLLDADIAILGSASTKYKQYSQAIRQEYKHVPSILYRFGRKKVLKHLANKTPFFYTTTFRDQFEDQAKKNLAWELSTL